MERCGFCGKESPEDDLAFCMLCGAFGHDHCPPVCCEEAISDAVDGWLEGLSINQVERL